MISWGRVGSYMLVIGVFTICHVIFDTEISLSGGLVCLGLGLAFVVYDWEDA